MALPAVLDPRNQNIAGVSAFLDRYHSPGCGSRPMTLPATDSTVAGVVELAVVQPAPGNGRWHNFPAGGDSRIQLAGVPTISWLTGCGRSRLHVVTVAAASLGLCPEQPVNVTLNVVVGSGELPTEFLRVHLG